LITFHEKVVILFDKLAKYILFIYLLEEKEMSRSRQESLVKREPVGTQLTIKDRHIVDGVDSRLQSPDNVYLDVQVVNNNPNEVAIAQYSTTRSSPIITKANDYYLAIARFQIPNNNIPLFLFKEDTYAVTMANGAASSKVYLQYNAPPGNISRAIYTIQEFLDSLNDAIVIACANVGIGQVPKVFLNRNNQLQSITFSDNANWLGLGIIPLWQMWMNWELFYFFETMQVYYAGNYDPVDGKAYRILVKDNYDGNYTAGTSYVMSQETQLLSLYISVFNIVVATTTLPVSAELISIKSGDSSASFNTVTDFTPGQLANYSDNFTPYIYNPQFYRLVDLLSNCSLNKLDFQIYYSDADGNVSPLYLLPSQRMTMKFIFVKKSLFNNEYN
jgi:hypothetical protein